MEAEWLSAIQQILEHAATLPDCDRAAYVQRACGLDHKLRREVDALLPHYVEVASFEPQRPRNAVVRLPGTTTIGDAFADPATETRTRTARSTMSLGPEWTPPFRLGSFACDALVGRGGMGAVFRARGGDHHGPVALKVMPFARLTDDRMRQFSLEAELLRQLRHPFLAQIHAIDAAELERPDLIPTPSEALPFLVMELVDGASLTQYAFGRRLPLAARLELLLAVCIAMSHAHHRGVTHCDLKPSNIMICSDGTPRLLDFGVARLMGDSPGSGGEVFCTPAYAAPEQVLRRADAIGPATDVFALGILGLELITGNVPPRTVQGEISADIADLCADSIADGGPLNNALPDAHTDAGALGAQQRREAAKEAAPAVVPEQDNAAERTPIDKPEPLLAVLRKALEHDRTERFATAGEMVSALEPIVKPAAQRTFWQRFWAWVTGESDESAQKENRALRAVLRQRLDIAVDAETYRLERKRRQRER